MVSQVPALIPNWIGGNEAHSESGRKLPKFSPIQGNEMWSFSGSDANDVSTAVSFAGKVQKEWRDIPSVERGELLHQLVLQLMQNSNELAEIIHLETGKAKAHALGEIRAAVQLGLFYSSEGQRLFGKTIGSGIRNRSVYTLRNPIGVAGLIISANTPIANIAWKVFPALICGNAAVLKASEDAPATAWYFGKLLQKTNLPKGVLQIIQGTGIEAGKALVNHPEVGVISFTGSTKVGIEIHESVSKRLARVSLELGGKNPFIVCDDADLEKAVHWAIQSAYSNAGQRCASGSRLIVMKGIYDEFLSRFLEKVKSLKVGSEDTDDFGPVINLRQLENMIAACEKAQKSGAKILTGGKRLSGDKWKNGYFMSPTLIEGADEESEISHTELFGPITNIYKADSFQNALNIANRSPYGLTAAIHTGNLHRAQKFIREIQSGIAIVNAGTFGSEPHLPFGGQKLSGNGTREPGEEALNVYSEWKNVYMNFFDENT